MPSTEGLPPTPKLTTTTIHAVAPNGWQVTFSLQFESASQAAQGAIDLIGALERRSYTPTAPVQAPAPVATPAPKGQAPTTAQDAPLDMSMISAVQCLEAEDKSGNMVTSYKLFVTLPNGNEGQYPINLNAVTASTLFGQANIDPKMFPVGRRIAVNMRIYSKQGKANPNKPGQFYRDYVKLEVAS